MGVTARNGWGVVQSDQVIASTSSAGQDIVMSNIGCAIQVVAGPQGCRLTHLEYDIYTRAFTAPENAPVDNWRILVLLGALPPDVTGYQGNRAYGKPAEEVPALLAGSLPQTVLWDRWIFNDSTQATVPGSSTNTRIREVYDFAGGSPEVPGGQTMSILVVPQLVPVTADAARAHFIINLNAFGTGGQTANRGAQGGGNGEASLPRWDTRLP